MSRELLASIDLGTNTARLLIGSVTDGKVTRCHIVRRITRLGGGFTKTSGISDEARQRSVAAMKEFAESIAAFRPVRLKAVTTSAVRDAANGREFCHKVLEETGIELEIISGEDEGRMTLSGVISGIDTIPEYLLVFDIGGGSTEYTLARGDEILFTRSLPLGVVRLTEGKSNITAISKKIEKELQPLVMEIRNAGFEAELAKATLLGTAGTATTLAAISRQLENYDYRLINNYQLSIDEIRDILARLLPLSPKERLAQVIGLEQGREDLIIAGTLLTLKTMELFGLPMLKVSDFGLLEGVLLDLASSNDIVAVTA
jgi:exopolyphosphatase/guanosine-5'-triphosphate,3'-diphosphate pyrophosphatase